MKNENTPRLPDAKNDQGGSGGRPSTTCYAPSELRFYAVYKGEIVRDGDHWLPDEKAGYWNCYPVKISSAGIHYTRRLADSGDLIRHSDGKTYYGSWEYEATHTKEVSLYLQNVKGDVPPGGTPLPEGAGSASHPPACYASSFVVEVTYEKTVIPCDEQWRPIIEAQ